MKTAVEWLVEKFNTTNGQLIESDLQQAKEMEKQQIKDAYNQGYRHGEVQECNLENDVANFDDAINYYNETFNKK